MCEAQEGVALLAAEWLSSYCHATAGLPRMSEMGSMRMAAPEFVWQSARGLIMQMGCCSEGRRGGGFSLWLVGEVGYTLFELWLGHYGVILPLTRRPARQ